MSKLTEREQWFYERGRYDVCNMNPTSPKLLAMLSKNAPVDEEIKALKAELDTAYERMELMYSGIHSCLSDDHYAKIDTWFRENGDAIRGWEMDKPKHEAVEGRRYLKRRTSVPNSYHVIIKQSDEIGRLRKLLDDATDALIDNHEYSVQELISIGQEIYKAIKGLRR